MKKEARDLLQTARLRSGSREEMKMIKMLRVEIPPVLEPHLPPDLIVDHDETQKKIKKELRRPLKQPRVETPRVIEPPLPPDLILTGLRILVFLLEISHPICLHHHCALIVRKMKMVRVTARTSIKKTLIMWYNAHAENIQIPLGILLWRTLYNRPTKRM